jgi:Ras-related protein Rab-1A
MEYDHLFKLIIVGKEASGKSSLMLSFVDNTFSTAYLCTIGVDFKIKTFNSDNSTIKLQIWDTAGKESYRTITASYYKGSHGVVLVYSINDRQSLEDLSKWVDEIYKFCEEGVSIILVGMKSDEEENRKVSTEEGMTFAQNHGMQFL